MRFIPVSWCACAALVACSVDIHRPARVAPRDVTAETIECVMGLPLNTTEEAVAQQCRVDDSLEPLTRDLMCARRAANRVGYVSRYARGALAMDVPLCDSPRW